MKTPSPFPRTTTPKGISATRWWKNSALRVQDASRVRDNNAKWKSVTRLFNESANAPANLLFINFTSGRQSGLFGIPNIPRVSNDINQRLETYLCESPPGLRGIVVMDFMTAETAALILNQNTP